KAAFGDDRVYVERFLASPRHIEVQVIGDGHGRVVHLGERDCSLQRRHQKVVEEAPSPVLDAGQRERLGGLVVAALRKLNYRSLGTVEFLYENGEFFFIEMNTRLQVEHPVTEAITGQDLVAWQLKVAIGEKLPLTQEQVTFGGHAIEVRLYAEDAYAGFLPQTGRIDVWRPATGPGVRIDHGMKEGLVISPFYDPMIAKVIAHGATREEARTRLVRALRETIVLGPTTNRHFLIRLLEHPEFAAGKATTAFLGKHEFPAPAIDDAHWQLAAELLWRQSASRYPATLRGWRNSNPEPTPIRLAVGDSERLLHVTASNGIDEHLPFHVDGDDVIVDLDALTVRFTDRTYAAPATAAAGSDGKLRAPMDGRIVAIKVAAGDVVAKGQTLIVLEAMKIQHQLKAALDAKVESVTVKEGQQVSNRAILVTMA
ncbi:MAG TPA: biotin/lipoyl-containing protein, partial [Reyranella sp.]|nr:biotin/lipoyl-containing protein [Reyranella sp.]